MQEITRDVYFEAANEQDENLRKALAQWTRQSDSRRTQENSVFLARYLKGIEIRNFFASFDHQPLLLNVRNGTIDLRTGQLLPHRREDFLTKMVPLDCDPTAICPKFSRFLNETFAFEQEGLVG
jgi:putative DNA primase/helicase